MNKKIFRLAIPNIITNITVPLLGMVDIAIAGHLNSSLYIGAISLGTTVLNLVYWNLGFIRMSTSGFTSQALGRRDFNGVISELFRSLIISVFLGLIILVFQYPIIRTALHFINTSDETKIYVGQYLSYCIWGAPFVLMQFAFNGWYVGMQNAKVPMFVAIFNNILNICLSFAFVYGFGMKIEGIALGTTLSQILTCFLTVVIWKRYYGRVIKYLKRGSIFTKEIMKSSFNVNSDIFIRTLLLSMVISFFTFASSSMGDKILAVNALILQFSILFSYFMDGFAYAGEALTGRYLGANAERSFKQMLKRLFLLGLTVMVVITLIYFIFPDILLKILTDKQDLINDAKNYILWICLIPICGFSAFLWDGIFIGATASTTMRNAMFVATAIFFFSFIISKSMHNNGLWISFLLFFAARSLVQTLYAKKTLRIAFKRTKK